MKKFLLTVPLPCHENWNQMAPMEKGRFCASCQKTVVDFTAMTDQQLVAYIRKEKGTVCGRFYPDQLNRSITFSRSPFTLPKHFFRYTWPAFLLFLKACHLPGEESVQTTGVVLETKLPEMPPVAGNLVLSVQQGDTVQTMTGEPIGERHSSSVCFTPPVIKGEADVKPFTDNVTLPVDRSDSSFAETDTARIGLDALRITPAPGQEEVFMMGLIAIAGPRENSTEAPAPIKTPAIKETKPMAFVVYPNPLAQGQPLTVVFKEDYTGSYHIYSSSGQLVQRGSVAVKSGQSSTLRLDAITAGTYFIRFAGHSPLQKASQQFVVR